MITIKKTLTLPDTYPLKEIGPPKDLLFFDIETTGFSGSSSQLYLIGCLYWQKDTWNLIQWFADSKDAEADLLHSFLCLVRQFKILLHFNGDTFDLPYLQKRCTHLGIDWDISHIKSLDLYKKIKPYRKLLGMDSLKQKAIEGFLGIDRTDTFSGGELVQVYQDYLVSHNQSLESLLLLHNEDDLKGMPEILPILNYEDFWTHPFSLIHQNICSEPDQNNHSSHQLKLTCQSEHSIPVPFFRKTPVVSCLAKDNCLYLTIELFQGILKHFYSNYKDYYYLPYEDTAIHKSVGEYVDKSARTKATAKNCYTKQEGLFLPQFDPIWEPAMQKEYKSKPFYVPLSHVNLKDPSLFHRYLCLLQKHLETI